MNKNEILKVFFLIFIIKLFSLILIQLKNELNYEKSKIEDLKKNIMKWN